VPPLPGLPWPRGSRRAASSRNAGLCVQTFFARLSAPAPETPRETISQIDKQMRELALDHAAGRIPDEAYLSGIAQLCERRQKQAGRVRPPLISAEQAAGYVDGLAAAWRKQESFSTRPVRSTTRQRQALEAFVSTGSVAGAGGLLGIRPSTVKRHLADLRARSGMTTDQLIYAGARQGWLEVHDRRSTRGGVHELDAC
jgi:hypothetical protein